MDMVPQHIFWPISGSFWGLRTRHQHRVLGLFGGARRAAFGSFGIVRDLGSPEPSNVPWHVLGLLADRPPRGLYTTFRLRVPLGLKSLKRGCRSAEIPKTCLGKF